jgi:metal-responsive CopG/Arc/MetJ family transcriptional regulator
MATADIAISIDQDLLAEVDRLVARKIYPSRSGAFESAVQEALSRVRRQQFDEECAKLDPAEEKALAEEGMAGELAQWPEY